MHHRNWFLAGLGLMLAVTGGVAEVRGHLLLGAAAVVLGLSAWVIFSGSSFHLQQVELDAGDLATDMGDANRFTGVFDDAAVSKINSSGA